MSQLPEISTSSEEHRAASNDEAPLSSASDSAIAGYSAAAFSLLTSGLGMEERHTLLEIGCGNLATARLLIPFMDEACYHGYDARRERIEAGIHQHCGADLIGLKAPRFESGAAFQASLFRKNFDFVLLHPQAIPSSTKARTTLLEEIVSCMKPATVVVATLPRSSHVALDHFIDQVLGLGFSLEFLRLGVAESVHWIVLRKNLLFFANTIRPVQGIDSELPDKIIDASGLRKPSLSTLSAPTSADDPETLRRHEQEIARYADCIDVHNLPEIYHFWSHGFVLPKLQSCGFDSVEDFFVQFIIGTCESDPGDVQQIISLGAGNCDLEVQLAQMVREHGLSNFHFNCLELNPIMVQRGEELARKHDLSDHFSFLITDIAGWQPEHDYAICIANHSLHHFVELEMIFEKVSNSLLPKGVFLTNDMIGRNGHMRWPEALSEIQRIWDKLPERYKYNHQLKRLEKDFVNWDCSQEGNEGIRAQDILPLLLEYFHFEVFIGFANLIDIFVDRSFGHNFDPDNKDDLAFVQEVAELDEAMIDRGEIKPTHILAAMRTAPVAKPMHYRHWTAEFCVRYPDW